MAAKLTCRECGIEIRGIPSISIGTLLKGGTFLCLSHVPNEVELRKWITEYVNSHKNPETVLRNRVKDLEVRLAMAQQTIKDLEFQQSRRNG